jgi:hypothetical protein
MVIEPLLSAGSELMMRIMLAPAVSSLRSTLDAPVKRRVNMGEQGKYGEG